MERIYVQGSLAEFEHDGDDLDRYYLPQRAAAHCLRPNTRLIVPDTPSTQEYLMHLSRVAGDVGVSRPETTFIPDTQYLLDNAISEHIDQITGSLRENFPYRIYPYANTQELREWTGELVMRGYQIDIAIPERKYFDDIRHPQHRGGWGVWVRDSNELTFPQRYNLPYPVSYIGVGIEEIEQARQLAIGETGVVYAKLLFSAGGFGVRRVESAQDLRDFYNQVRDSGSLELFGQEQPFELQREIGNISTFASIQFADGLLITPGSLSEQIVNGNNWAGNVFGTLPDRLKHKAVQLANKFTKAYTAETGQSATGGLDLAVVKVDGDLDLMVVEPNLARTVGADPAISLAKTFGVSDRPFMIRKTGVPQTDLQTIWDMMSTESLKLNPQTGRGAFPLLWTSETDGFLFVSGRDGRDIREISDRVVHMAGLNGYVKDHE